MRKLRFFILLVVMIALVPCIDSLGLLSGVDTYFYDTFLRLRGERSVSPRIVIVAIDAKTLDAYGRWPLKRKYYAAMLDKLDRSAVVGFDLLFMEPGEDDALLADAIKRQGRVILAEYLDSSSNVLKPLQRLSPHGTGHIHIEAGIDHIAREVFHSIYSNGRLLPSLTSVMYETVTGTTFRRTPSAAVENGAPIRQNDLHKINFYGPPGTFNQVSMVDVINGVIPPAYFKNRIVLVGVTAPGIIDAISTPFSQSRNRMSGVEVHAGILHNLLESDSINDLPGWLCSGLVLVLSFALSLFFMRLNEKSAVLTWCAALFLAPASAFFLLVVAEKWLPPASFMLSFSMVFAAVYLYRLDSAVRRLDHEYEVMTSLLGRTADENYEQGKTGGLASFISEGGINEKIRRQTDMSSRLFKLHKQLELALKNEREALDNQIRFVEILSHEYRTPLAIIRANLDIMELKDNDSGERFSAYYAKMKRAISRLVEVVDTSFGHDRVDENCTAVKNGEIELTAFLRNLLQESRELWTERQLQLELDHCAECRTPADTSLFKTAILNLIDNAVKYSPENSPVRISLATCCSTAVIRVCNRGPTIPPGDLEQVFNKYYRGRGSANIHGAGLGLYLVRKIIEQHGATVTLSSNERDGTCATVRIPLE